MMINKISRFGLSQVSRRCLSDNSLHAAGKVSDVTKNSSSDGETINMVGKIFNEIQENGKGGKHLPIDDLRHLFRHCQTPDHINHITHGVKMWQTKGQDFNEDTASHFVRACLRAENPKVAAEICSNYKNRIGAWLTPKVLTLLVDALVSKGEIEAGVNMYKTISRKGVISSRESIEAILTAMKADEEKYKEHMPAMMVAASKMVSTDDYAIITEKFADK